MEKAIGWMILGIIGMFLVITSVQGRVGVLLACAFAPDSIIVNKNFAAKSTQSSIFDSGVVVSGNTTSV